MELEIEGLELTPGVRQDFPSAQWLSLFCWGLGSDPKLAGAEALRVEPKLALFPLNVCFSLFLYWDSGPRGGTTEAIFFGHSEKKLIIMYIKYQLLMIKVI